MHQLTDYKEEFVDFTRHGMQGKISPLRMLGFECKKIMLYLFIIYGPQ